MLRWVSFRLKHVYIYFDYYNKVTFPPQYLKELITTCVARANVPPSRQGLIYIIILFFPKVVREWKELNENERAIYDPNEVKLAWKRKLPKWNPLFCTGPRKYQILHTRLRVDFTILWSVKNIPFSGTRRSEWSWIFPLSQWKPHYMGMTVPPLTAIKIYLLLFVNISRPQGGSTLLASSSTLRICEIIMLMY